MAQLRHGRPYVPMPDDEDLLTVGLNRAVTRVAEKQGWRRTRPGRRKRYAASPDAARRPERTARTAPGRGGPKRLAAAAERRQCGRA